MVKTKVVLYLYPLSPAYLYAHTLSTLCRHTLSPMHTHTHTQPYAHILSALCTHTLSALCAHTLSPMMSYKFFQLHVTQPPSILCHTPALSTFITSIPSVLSYVPSALSAPGRSKFLIPLQYIPLTTPPLAQYRVYLHH